MSKYYLLFPFTLLACTQEISKAPTTDIDPVDDENVEEEVEEVEEFTQATDSIPEKKVSVSIEKLRKKMSDDKEN